MPHQRLLHKLNSYGIRSHTLNWINAFLTNRSHQVLVNGSHSETHIVTSGVPQGTVLGPFLADSHSLQQDTLLLQDWADKWQMKFNIKKCKLLRITKRTNVYFKCSEQIPSLLCRCITIHFEKKTAIEVRPYGQICRAR